VSPQRSIKKNNINALYSSRMSPYLDDEIMILQTNKKRSINGAESAVSFDSAVTP